MPEKSTINGEIYQSGVFAFSVYSNIFTWPNNDVTRIVSYKICPGIWWTIWTTYYSMSLTLVLFLIGILGFVFNRKNIILMLISIEIMLLSITFLILVSSINLDDIIGQTYAIYIIVVAGAESAIGLAILVAFYRLRGSIAIEYK